MLDVRAPDRSRTARALGAWAGLIVVAIVWGELLRRAHRPIDIAAPPFWSRFDPHPSPRIIPALGVAALVIRWAPRLTRSLRWPALLASFAGTSAAWAITVAYIDGSSALTDPVRFSRNDYLQTAREVPSLHRFVAHYIDNIEV